MAGTQTTSSLSGAPNLGNLGAVQLHPTSGGLPQGVALPDALQRRTGYVNDAVPFSLAPTVSDPSMWSATGVQG